MKKKIITKIKYEIPPQFDWEAPHFLKKSFQILEESEKHSLFKEETEVEQRSFALELQLWMDRWKHNH